MRWQQQAREHIYQVHIRRMLWTHLIRWHTLLDNLCNLRVLDALETFRFDMLNKTLLLSLSHTCLANMECKKPLQIDLMLTILRGTVHKWSRLLTLNIFQLDSRHKKFDFGEVAYCQGCMAGTLPMCFCFEKNQLGT